MNRQQAEQLIVKTFWGAPGEEYVTPDGRDLIMQLLEWRGLAALTDDAVIQLAGMHRSKDERLVP